MTHGERTGHDAMLEWEQEGQKDVEQKGREVVADWPGAEARGFGEETCAEDGDVQPVR